MKLAVLVFVLGCGGSKDDGKVASCNLESVQSCREYRGGNLALGIESLQKLCTVLVSTAKFSETACPTAGVIATCAKDEGKDFYYEGNAEPLDAIEASCKRNGGTFAAKK